MFYCVCALMVRVCLVYAIWRLSGPLGDLKGLQVSIIVMAQSAFRGLNVMRKG